MCDVGNSDLKQWSKRINEYIYCSCSEMNHWGSESCWLLKRRVLPLFFFCLHLSSYSVSLQNLWAANLIFDPRPPIAEITKNRVTLAACQGVYIDALFRTFKKQLPLYTPITAELISKFVMIDWNCFIQNVNG